MSHVCICQNLCSPGMNAESEMDDKVIECCSDADVFVYVANGTTTFETTVSLCKYMYICMCRCSVQYKCICYIYSTVGRSIAGIYDPRRHIYRGAKRRGKYAAEVVYIGYGPTYRIIYTTYILW